MKSDKHQTIFFFFIHIYRRCTYLPENENPRKNPTRPLAVCTCLIFRKNISYKFYLNYLPQFSSLCIITGHFTFNRVVNTSIFVA